MEEGTIFFWGCNQFKDVKNLKFKHQEKINWNNRLNIIDEILKAGLNVMIYQKEKVILVDNGKFRQR